MSAYDKITKLADLFEYKLQKYAEDEATSGEINQYIMGSFNRAIESSKLQQKLNDKLYAKYSELKKSNPNAPVGGVKIGETGKIIASKVNGQWIVNKPSQKISVKGSVPILNMVPGVKISGTLLSVPEYETIISSLYLTDFEPKFFAEIEKTLNAAKVSNTAIDHDIVNLSYIEVEVGEDM